MGHNYTYQSALAASERIGWKVDDLIGGDKKLDFTKPFMPESLGAGKAAILPHARAASDTEPDPRT